jgi:hypothetical protein
MASGNEINQPVTYPIFTHCLFLRRDRRNAIYSSLGASYGKNSQSQQQTGGTQPDFFVFGSSIGFRLGNSVFQLFL